MPVIMIGVAVLGYLICHALGNSKEVSVAFAGGLVIALLTIF
jgi:hypothetical protein